MKPNPSPAIDGQESVGDYPRPPRIEPSSHSVLIKYKDLIIAESRMILRVLETSLAPSYYVPREDVFFKHLRLSTRITRCEWKGAANYLDLLVDDEVIPNVACTYEAPVQEIQAIEGCLALYPGLVDCFLDGEQV
jgi:uncharacterized protein (DUF427 family)